MTGALQQLARVLLWVPAIALASPSAFNVRTTSTSVIVQNTTTDNYMEMLISVGGCGTKVLAPPGQAVTIPITGARRDVEVKSIKLTPIRHLIADAKANLQPVPQPITDPKTIASMRPVCLELK
ncbi:MAG TPA: hypothetical protein VF816_03690 [Rhodocyclaceae bacterium]